MLFLNIIDGGADTHVIRASWIKLFTVNNNTPLVDAVGFDSQTARKYNLPIGPHATKPTDTSCREIILVAAHGVGNSPSKHTLSYSYQIRIGEWCRPATQKKLHREYCLFASLPG